MSLVNWLGQLRSFRNAVPAFNGRVGRVLASTAGAAVNNRVVETGTDAQGRPLVHAKSGKQYSDAELPLSTFVDQGTITREQAKGLPILVSYVDVKKKIGRFRGKRDMMLTGRMWGSTRLVEERADQNTFYARVAGANAETQMKLDRNSEMSNVDLLEMSKQEQADLALDYDTELQVFVDQHFTG